MVFENLTLFEIHFEDATIGPNVNTDEPDAQSEGRIGDKATEDGGVSVGRLVIASVVVSIVVRLLVRKLAGEREDAEVEIDAPEEPGDVSIDT